MIVKISHSLLLFRSTSLGENWTMGEFAHNGFFSREPNSVSYRRCPLGKSRDFLTIIPGEREHTKMCMNGPPH